MNSLIIYFSRADENYAVGFVEKGNTERAAEYVRDVLNCDMFKVEPVVPYSKYYNTCLIESKERIGNAPIKNKIVDISKYDTIYIMTPIYWGTYAPEIETAIKDLDLSNKKVRVLTTHEGTGLGSVLKDIERICKGVTIYDALTVKGSEVTKLKDSIEKWVLE